MSSLKARRPSVAIDIVRIAHLSHSLNPAHTDLAGDERYPPSGGAFHSSGFTRQLPV